MTALNILVDLAMLAMLTGSALIIVRNHSPLSVVLVSGMYSLALCTMFVVLDAVDVAFTEAAVGAGISTILMLCVLSPDDERRVAPSWPSTSVILLALVMGVMLVAGTLDMPLYGNPSAPIHHHLAPRFLQQSGMEIGIPNVVTSVLASYRGYDTLGEVVVVFTAGTGVLILMANPAQPLSKDRSDTSPVSPVISMVLLRIIPLVVLFALYVQFHGDYGPGGGFQAGVIFAVGIITYGLVRGPGRITALMSESWIVAGMAGGALIYGGVGVVSMLLGRNFLDYSALADDAAAGQHIGILVIELGVGITVAFTMISLFVSFNRKHQEES